MYIELIVDQKSIIVIIANDLNMFVYGLIDIDDFTLFNLSNGFQKGNDILNGLEELIQSKLHTTTWQKLNSDEFIFFLHGPFEQNKQKLLDLLTSCQRNLNVTISLGLLELDCKYSFDQIINRLMISLLMAKNHGKNKMCLL